MFFCILATDRQTKRRLNKRGYKHAVSWWVAVTITWHTEHVKNGCVPACLKACACGLCLWSHTMWWHFPLADVSRMWCIALHIWHVRCSNCCWFDVLKIWPHRPSCDACCAGERSWGRFCQRSFHWPCLHGNGCCNLYSCQSLEVYAVFRVK